MRFFGDPDDPLYEEVLTRVGKATSWRTRIKRCMPESNFLPAASDAMLRKVERALGHCIPKDLQALLRECNGVDTPYSSLVYSTDRLIEVNLTMRSADYLADRMPLDHLLFFGGVGDGDEFGFPRNRDGSFGTTVFIWSHETDAREEYAMGLFDYIVKYTVEIYTPYMKNRNVPIDER